MPRSTDRRAAILVLRQIARNQENDDKLRMEAVKMLVELADLTESQSKPGEKPAGKPTLADLIPQKSDAEPSRNPKAGNTVASLLSVSH